jgi:trigger factor
MKVNVEELSSVQRRMTVEIPSEEVDRTLDTLYRRLRRQVRIKGFRKGKAPRSILERYYGAQMAMEAAESLIGDTYREALIQAQQEPLARPEWDFEPPVAGQPFVYKVTFDVKPVFELDPAAYKGITLKEPDLKVTEEEIAQRLEALRERQAVLKPLEEDRKARTGDVVVVNYESFLGEEPVEGGAADNVEVELGKGQVQEEIEVALVGTRPGEIVEANVEYGPEASRPELRGKTVRFKLFVKEIRVKELPELDDDFARSLGPEFESLEELKDKIRQELDKTYQEQKDASLRTQILDAIRDLGQFDLPTSLVEQETEEMVESFKRRLKSSGMDPEAAGLDENKLREDFRRDAERKVRAGIVLGRIAEQEGVEVSEEDVEAEIARIAERVGQPASVIKEIYKKNNMMPDLRAQVLQEKTLQLIKAGANIELVDPAELAAEMAQKQEAEAAQDGSGAGDDEPQTDTDEAEAAGSGEQAPAGDSAPADQSESERS